MNKLRQLSLNFTIPIILSIVFILFQGAVLYFEYTKAQTKLYVNSEQHVKGIAGQLQTSLSNALMRLEKAQAQADISTVALDDNIKTIAVIDANQQIVLSNNFRERYMFAKLQLEQYDGNYLNQVITKNQIFMKYNSDAQELLVYAPLQMISKGNSLNRKYNGVVFIRYSLANAYRELIHASQLLLIKISIITFFSVLLISFFINQLILRHLKKLTNSLESVDQIMNIELDVTGYGEVARLEKNVNNLLNDISNNMDQLAADEERWVYAINGSQNGVWDWDIKNDQVFYSNRWKDILGYHHQQLESDIIEWEKRLHPDDVYEIHKDLAEHFSGKKTYFDSAQRILCFNGEYKWILSRGQVVAWDKAGEPLRMIGTICDLNFFTKLNEKVKYHSNFENINKLANREQFISQIEKANEITINANLYKAVVCFDCNQYEMLNELNSHDSVEELLTLIEKRLKDNKSIAEYIAHIRGSEFVVLLPDLHENETLAKQFVNDYVCQLNDLLKAPYILEEKQVYLDFSFGMTLFQSSVIQSQIILRQSFMAMKAARVNLHSNMQFFSKSIEDKRHQEHNLNCELRKGIKNNDFSLFFQPRVDASGNFVAAEVLARWYRKDIGWVDASDYTPIAESSNLIMPLGDWIIRHSLLELKKWIEQGLPKSFKTLSVNISTKQLLQKNFVSNIKMQLAETNIQAKLIEIEITETTLLNSEETIIDKLNELRELGFTLAIDDFGTGYSSLSHLSRLPIKVLKIDQSFITGLLESKSQQDIVSSIISMGKSLNLNIVVEGVETEQQYKFLIAKGCHQLQGFYIGEPLASESFRKSQFLIESIKT